MQFAIARTLANCYYMKMNIKQFIELSPGNAAKLAAEIGAHPPDVSMWASKKRAIPIKYGAKIEQATGGQVTRKVMFPDCWQDVWPELKETSPKE